MIQDVNEKNFQITEQMLEIAEQLNKEYIVKKKPVLFHCFAGRSRSVFMCILTMMLHFNFKSHPIDLYAQILKRRNCVAINRDFIHALVKFYNLKNKSK